MIQPKETKSWPRRALDCFRKFLSSGAFRSAFFAFALTRMLIVFVLLLSANMKFEPAVSDEFGVLHESSVSLGTTPVSDVLKRATLGADSLWIINIARDGYEKEQFNTNIQHTWAYFPLYPLLLRAASKLTGDLPLTGIVLSSLFFLVALILLHQTATVFYTDAGVADRTVFYIAAFPASYFFSMSQTESLFLLLSVGCFLAAKEKRFWLAGICGALASATRLAGVFLVVPLAVLYWQDYTGAGNGDAGNSKVKLDVASLLLVPLGLISFMLYLRHITGNAFAFADIQAAWGHDFGMFWRPVASYLSNPLMLSAGWDFRLLNFVAAVTAIVCGAVLLKRREWALGLYALVSILVPMSYQSSLQSLARYTMVIFPVFVVLAGASRSLRVNQIIQTVFIALLTLMSAMLAVRVTVALS